MCFGGKTVDTPEPSAQEIALLDMILNQLIEQQAYNDMMMPEYARQLGYKIVEGEGKPYEYTEADNKIIEQRTQTLAQYEKYKKLYEQNPHDTGYWSKYKDAENSLKSLNAQYDQLQKTKETYEAKASQQLVKMTDEEWYSGMTDSEKRQYDLNKETQTRQLKALRGELPLTESLQQQKAKEFEQLKGTYGITGDDENAAVATDTIGTQNLSEFKKRWNALEEQERYGQLGSGTQATVAMSGLTSDLTNRNIGSLSSLGGQNAGLTSGYYSLLQPYMAYTQAGYQAQAQNQLTQSQRQASLLGMAGMIGGGIIGGYFGGPAGAAAGASIGGAGGASLGSSKKYKTDIKTKTKKDEDKALKEVLGTRSVEYRYKKGMGLGLGKRLGAIAEEVPKSIANSDRTAIKLGDKLELTIMAMKALNRKIERQGA